MIRMSNDLNGENGLIPTRTLSNLLRKMNITMNQDEIEDLQLLIDPHALGSFTEVKLVNALANMMSSYEEAKV